MAITAFELCEIISNHIGNNKRAGVNRQIFNEYNSRNEYKFFYFKKPVPEMEKIKSFPSNDSENANICVVYNSYSENNSRGGFDQNTRELRSKWRNAFAQCQDALYENICAAIKLVSAENILKLYDELYTVCVDEDFLEYLNICIPETAKSLADNKTRLREITSLMTFLIFLNCINVDPKTSSVFQSLMKKISGGVRSAELYFEQSAYETNENEPLIKIFADGSVRWDRKDKHILVSAVGGNGKSLFIDKIKNNPVQRQNFSAVVKILLSSFVSFVEEKRGNIGGCFSDTELFQIYLQNFCGISSREFQAISDSETQKPILILLDGMNEIYSSKDVDAIARTETEIMALGRLSNVYIIITTRDVVKINPLLIANDYKIVSLTGVTKKEYDEFINKHPNLDNSIKELAKIPLYFKHLTSIDEGLDGLKTRFYVLRHLFITMTHQTALNVENTSAVYFAFYVIAAKIACAFESKAGVVSCSELVELVKKELKHNKKVLDALYNWALHNLGTAEPYEYDDKSAYQIANILTTSGLLVADPSRPMMFKFWHDDIRSFLVSLSCINQLEIVNALYCEDDNDVFNQFLLNLNISDDASKLVIEGLGFRDKESTTQKLEELFGGLLQDNADDIGSVLKKISVANVAYQISLFLPWPDSYLDPSIRRIIGSVVELVSKRKKSLHSLLGKLQLSEQSFYRKALSNIICKKLQYLRVDKCYKSADELLGVAEQILGALTQHIVHQKAKLYLAFYHVFETDLQSIPENELLCKTRDEAQKLFAEGIEIFEHNSTFIFSATLLAFLLSKPSPFIFKKLPPDLVRAFLIYNSIFFSEDKVEGFIGDTEGYTKREIMYPATQMLNLLINGIVTLRDGCEPSPEELDEEVVQLGNKNPLDINDETFEFVENILDTLMRKFSSPVLDYVRGRVAYWRGEKESAKRLFESSSDKNILSQLFLKYFYERTDLDDSINEKYAKIVGEFSGDSLKFSVDKTHPAYIYSYAKQFELSVDSESKRKFDRWEENISDELNDLMIWLECQ